jgi:uncharacterized protein YjbI with pentapeptide repeats
MNISQPLMKLITTGDCQDGVLDDIDIMASLYHAGAINADIDYQQFVLDRFDGKLILNGASLQKSSFRRLQLKSIDLKKAKLWQADLSDVIWEQANFAEASLGRARLNRAILRNANFENAYLESADLLGADLSDCNFSGANLDGADIRAANFTRTNCKGVIFDDDGPRDPRFLGANFTDANLEGARISPNAFESVYLCRTIMPDGTVSDRDCELVKTLFGSR